MVSYVEIIERATGRALERRGPFTQRVEVELAQWDLQDSWRGTPYVMWTRIEVNKSSLGRPRANRAAP